MLRSFALAVSIGCLVVALPYAPPLARVGPSGVVAAQTDPQDTHPSTPESSQSQAGMPDMMKMHQQMMADMHAADTRLDNLVKAMNVATGEARIPAIAKAVTELAAQQKAMHDHMGMMHEHMGMMPMGGAMLKK